MILVYLLISLFAGNALVASDQDVNEQAIVNVFIKANVPMIREQLRHSSRVSYGTLLPAVYPGKRLPVFKSLAGAYCRCAYCNIAWLCSRKPSYKPYCYNKDYCLDCLKKKKN